MIHKQRMTAILVNGREFSYGLGWAMLRESPRVLSMPSVSTSKFIDRARLAFCEYGRIKIACFCCRILLVRSFQIKTLADTFEVNTDWPIQQPRTYSHSAYRFHVRARTSSNWRGSQDITASCGFSDGSICTDSIVIEISYARASMPSENQTVRVYQLHTKCANPTQNHKPGLPGQFSSFGRLYRVASSLAVECEMPWIAEYLQLNATNDDWPKP